jgi:hypothetical protein
MTSFTNKKDLKFIITLGTGTFGSSSNNTITLQGYRASVNIDKAGGMMMGTLKAQIYGMSQSDMSSVTTLQWHPKAIIQNTVQIFAIDGNAQTLVFTGNIINAWANYDAMPDVFLMIQAQAAYFAQITPSSPISYNGPVDVATAMSQLAKQMGLTFENNGVNVKLSNQYLPNTALEQAKALAQAAGIWMFIDNGVLAITPAGTGRNQPIPLLSAQTGLVGYPTFDGVGVNFKCLYNPAVIFGGSIQLVSDNPAINSFNKTGVWIVTSVALQLESQKLNGAWFMRIRGNQSGLAVVS